MIDELKKFWEYRQLLANLTKKDLKLKYKNSILGFIRSLLNPLMLLIIYTFAFKYIFKQQIENFSIFVLSGLLAWTFFQGSIMGSVNSIVSNSNLVKKVYFPRTIIPISVVLSSFINYMITLVILGIAIIVSDIKISVAVLLLPVILILLLVFTVGLGLALSALNVRYRDIAHFMEIIFMGWFYITPIIYSTEQIPNNLRFIAYINPLTTFIESIRSVLIYAELPNLISILSMIVYSLGILVLGIVIFNNLKDKFAEEI